MLEVVTTEEADGTIKVIMTNHGSEVAVFPWMSVEDASGHWSFCRASRVFRNNVVAMQKQTRPVLVRFNNEIVVYNPEHHQDRTTPLNDMERENEHEKIVKGGSIEKLFPGKSAVLISFAGHAFHDGTLDRKQVIAFLEGSTIVADKLKFPLKLNQ